jgi:hypothetical protein
VLVGIDWLIDLKPEVWTALATAAIAAFTATLWWSTRGMLKTTNKTIDLTRDEFNATHRPRIRIKHLWLADDIWGGQQVRVNLGIVNTGTVVATIHQIGVRFVVARADQFIPFDPNIPGVPVGAQLVSGVWMTIPDISDSDGTTLTNPQNADIQEGRSKLYCIGYVSYLDAAGRMRITGFCRVLSVPQNTLALATNCHFFKTDDPDYEYED